MSRQDLRGLLNERAFVHLSDAVAHLMQGCMLAHAHQRFTVAQLLEHQWFTLDT
jgi:hypothetical protein